MSLTDFQNFPGPVAFFQDFPALENAIIKFQDFPGFPGPMRTLNIVLISVMTSVRQPNGNFQSDLLLILLIIIYMYNKELTINVLLMCLGTGKIFIFIYKGNHTKN